MAVTTEAAIRDRIISLIIGLQPLVQTSLRFVKYRNEGGANFRKWAKQNPAACTRRVQVRRYHLDRTNDVCNTDVEARRVTFDAIVAYEQSQRWGADAALDRDDAMESDQKQIEHAIGRDGYGNFVGAFPNASWLSAEADNSLTETFVETNDEDGVDFLVIRQTMRFYRSTT
jgi:hypothetical protein